MRISGKDKSSDATAASSNDGSNAPGGSSSAAGGGTSGASSSSSGTSGNNGGSSTGSGSSGDGSGSSAAAPTTSLQKLDKDVDRIIDSRDNEFVLSASKDAVASLTLDPQFTQDVTCLLTMAAVRAHLGAARAHEDSRGAGAGSQWVTSMWFVGLVRWQLHPACQLQPRSSGELCAQPGARFPSFP